MSAMDQYSDGPIYGAEIFAHPGAALFVFGVEAFWGIIIVVLVMACKKVGTESVEAGEFLSLDENKTGTFSIFYFCEPNFRFRPMKHG
jgi:hypothetical protein